MWRALIWKEGKETLLAVMVSAGWVVMIMAIVFTVFSALRIPFDISRIAKVGVAMAVIVCASTFWSEGKGLLKAIRQVRIWRNKAKVEREEMVSLWARVKAVKNSYADIVQGKHVGIAWDD